MNSSLMLILLLVATLSCSFPKADGDRNPANAEPEFRFGLLKVPLVDPHDPAASVLEFPLLNQDLYEKKSRHQSLILIGRPGGSYYPDRLVRQDFPEGAGFTMLAPYRAQDGLSPWFIFAKNAKGIQSIHSFLHWKNTNDLEFFSSLEGSEQLNIKIKDKRSNFLGGRDFYLPTRTPYAKIEDNDEIYLSLKNIHQKHLVYGILKDLVFSTSNYQIDDYLEGIRALAQERDLIPIMPRPLLSLLLESERKQEASTLKKIMPPWEWHNISVALNVKYHFYDPSPERIMDHFNFDPLPHYFADYFSWLNSSALQRKNQKDFDQYYQQLQNTKKAFIAAKNHGLYYHPLNLSTGLLLEVNNFNHYPALKIFDADTLIAPEELHSSSWPLLEKSKILGLISLNNEQSIPQDNHLAHERTFNFLNELSAINPNFTKMAAIKILVEMKKIDDVSLTLIHWDKERDKKISDLKIELFHYAQLLPLIGYANAELKIERSIFGDQYQRFGDALTQVQKFSALKIPLDYHPYTSLEQELKFDNCFQKGVFQWGKSLLESECLNNNLKLFEGLAPYTALYGFELDPEVDQSLIYRTMQLIHWYRLGQMFNLPIEKGIDSLNQELKQSYPHWYLPHFGPATK